MFFFRFFSSSCSKSAFFKPRNAHFKASSRSRAVSAASGYPATWDMTHWPNDWFHKACKRKTLYSCLSLSLSLSYRVYRTKVRLSGAVLGKAKLCASDQVLSKAPEGCRDGERRNKGETALCRGRTETRASVCTSAPDLTFHSFNIILSSLSSSLCAGHPVRRRFVPDRSRSTHTERERARERARERQQGAPSVPPPRQQQRRGREAESV